MQKWETVPRDKAAWCDKEKKMTDINPGELWNYRDSDYEIVNTGLLAGELKRFCADNFPVPVIVYRSSDVPLLFVRERNEFLRKFTQVTKRKMG